MYATTLYDSIYEIPRLPDVIELIRPQLGSHRSGNEPDEIRASLSAALRPGSRAWMIVLTVEATGEPVGFAFFNVCSGLETDGDYIWLNEIFVSETERGRGGGKRILEHLQDWAARRSAKAVYGICGKENTASHAFYRRLGFDTAEAVWISREVR